MTAHEIRRYQCEDAQACCDIIKRCLPTMGGLNGAAHRFLLSKLQPATLDAELAGLFTLVVVRDGAVMGVGALDGAEVKRVYVEPVAHGKGYGGMLLQYLEAEARRAKIQRLWVESSPNAERFYAQHGYTAHERAHFEIEKARFEVVRMSKVVGRQGEEEWRT